MVRPRSLTTTPASNLTDRCHAHDLRLAFEECHHAGILAGEFAQREVVMRVRQATDVEHHVGVERNPALEAEGLKHQRHARTVDAQKFLDPGAERIRREFAGVEAHA